MSTLSQQADELRLMVVLLREYVYKEISRMLREAADTIEALSDKLQEEGDVVRDYRASQIAAEAERRLQESYGQVPEQEKYGNDGERESCESRYSKLFGTPERAARAIVDSCNDDYDYGCGGCPVARVNCKCGDYDALLEWLRGDA